MATTPISLYDPPSPVITKLDFVRRYALGEFGNAAPTWSTLEEYLEGGYPGLVHLRNRVAGGRTWYDLFGPNALRWAWNQTTERHGVAPEQLYISAMAPTEKTILQGEVQQASGGRCGLELYYSTVRKPMRDALRERAATADGILADSLLRGALCPNSYEWLQELIKRYPAHVVEFSAYSTCWGTLYPRFNTVFWEVRSY